MWEGSCVVKKEKVIMIGIAISFDKAGMPIITVINLEEADHE